MEEVIEDIEKIISSTKAIPDGWNTLVDKRKDKLNGGLAMVHNHAILCLELLDCYKKRWSGKYSLAPSEAEKARKENAERIIEATKGMFLHCLSAIEFSMKHALKMNAHPLKKPDNRIKLINLIKDSLKEKLINQEEYDRWYGIVNIRNTVVHNNAIWDGVDKFFEYPDGLSVNLENNGKEIQCSSLRFFAQLTHWMVFAYIRWSEAIMKFHD